MADFPAPKEGFIVTYFLVSNDVAKSRDFYAGVLGGEVVRDDAPAVVQLANSWLIINTGGGPTDDKPDVTLDLPTDQNRVSVFMNLRVADIHSLYEEWKGRGAQFITEPKDHGYEIRAYMRDPDGYLIEVGQLVAG